MRLFDEETGRLLTVGGPANASLMACGTTLATVTTLADADAFVTLDVVVRALLDAAIDVTYVHVVDDAHRRPDGPAAADGRIAVDGPVSEGGPIGEPADPLTDEAVAQLGLDLAALGVIPPDRLVGVGESGGGEARPDVVAAIALTHLGPQIDLLAGRDEAHPADVEASLRALTGDEHPVARHLRLAAVSAGERRQGEGAEDGADADTIGELLERGVPPMAVRLMLLAQHHRRDWTYTAELLERAQERLARWTEAFSGNGGPDVEAMVREVRAALVDDLDTPRALRAVDAWADEALALATATTGIALEGAPGIASRVVDALLGVRM